MAREAKDYTLTVLEVRPAQDKEPGAALVFVEPPVETVAQSADRIEALRQAGASAVTLYELHAQDSPNSPRVDSVGASAHPTDFVDTAVPAPEIGGLDRGPTRSGTEVIVVGVPNSSEADPEAAMAKLAVEATQTFLRQVDMPPLSDLAPPTLPSK